MTELSAIEKILETIGEIKGIVEGHAIEIRYARADIAAIRQAQQLHGIAVAEIRTECVRRGKKCSEEIRSLKGKMFDVAEDTGVHFVEARTRWNMLKTLAFIVISLISVSATVIGIYNHLQNKNNQTALIKK